MLERFCNRQFEDFTKTEGEPYYNAIEKNAIETFQEMGGELENEYVAAQRFIHSAPLEANIDNAWLETVARKIRGRVEPVLAAVAQLRAAIEAQN